MVARTYSHYNILEKLGEGGMGVVYKAEDTKLKREVAIKFLPRQISAQAEDRKRFLIEAQAAAGLNHPNITTIHAIEEVDGELFIVMEHIDGSELNKIIAAGSLKFEDTLNIAIQVAEGLQAAHEKGITHRDIKPANIMVTAKGQVKIMDFGLAKVAGGALVTKVGTTVGTAAYMSPEQAHGDAVDHRTDIWAFGVTLYETFTGKRPFRGEYEQAVIYSILNVDPKPMTDFNSAIPASLENLVKRALAKHPPNRYQSIAALLADLRKLKPGTEGRIDLRSDKQHEPEKTSTRQTSKSRVATPQRRQMTVMCCDLMLSALRGEPLDPEELHAVLPAYQELCNKVIIRFDGYVVQQLGNSLTVYFGYPYAYEDDARRAVHAGLGILEGMRWLNVRIEKEKGIKLAARISIHTGVVIAGDQEDRSQKDAFNIVGENASIATQLLHFADPDSLITSQANFRLIEGYFDCRELGEHSIKGIAKPISVYQVLHESAARTRLEAAAVTGLTPLTGREKEIGILQERWDQVVEGNGQVVLLGGEAGIGKSRLLQELKQHVARDPQAWLTECYCSAYHQSSALYPIIDLLERVVLQLKREDSPQDKLKKLEEFLVRYGMPLPETVPLLASLLSISLDENYPPLALTPERQKQKMLAVLLTVLLERAAQQPVLFIIEDLHWADPSTLELLNLIVDQGPTTKIFTLLTFRPDFTPPWPMRSHLTYITLNRLPQKEVANMVARVTKGKTLPAAVRDHVLSHSDGVPLFVEEMTKMVLESGLLKDEGDQYALAGSLTQLAIPTTLRDSLEARLDRLPTAKEVAQLASVLGREFPFEWLQAVSPLDEAPLHEELARLVDAELLYRRGVAPKVSYLFKHALIQEAAYESLLKSTRQEYHGQIAEKLVAEFPETGETRPELLAHHYTEAGMKQKALDYWQRAGKLAAQRSANQEAIAHLKKALAVLETLPASPEKVQQELALQMTLGPTLMAIKGYAAPEVEATYARARQICEQIGDTPQIVMVLFGLWAFYVVRGDLKTARDLGGQILRLVEGAEDSGLPLEAHVVLGVTFYFLGEFPTAKEHLEKAIALYDPEKHASHALLVGQDPGMASRIYLAKALRIMGYAEQADRYMKEAKAIADNLKHSHTTAFCLTYMAVVKQYGQEVEDTKNFAQQTIALSTEQGFPIWVSAGQVMHGWALARLGQCDEGIAEIKQGISSWRATGTGLYTPHWLAQLAEVHVLAGNLETAQAIVEEAISLEEKGEERVTLADLYRLKGDLLLKLSADKMINEKAETCFQKALDIARHQSANLWELRAAIGLARLWKSQKKSEQAKALLKSCFEKVSEGLTTVDLKEASELLD